MTRPMTMPQRIVTPAPYGSLLKQPRGAKVRTRPFHAVRERDEGHLAAIRLLPCLKCGLEPCGEAAHVRQNSGTFNKRQAMGAKPHDRWSLPLDRGCHVLDPDSLHKVGEVPFFDVIGLNPLLVCEALYAVSPDVVKMRAVVFSFMAGRRCLQAPSAIARRS